MKTKMSLVILIFTTAFAALAQLPGKGKKEEIKAERRAFIDRFVGLSGTEAEKFWKLEEELHVKLHEIRKTMRQEFKAIKDKGIENATDTELKRAMDNRLKYEQKMLDLRQEYHTRFIDLIGVKKTAKFYEGEREFKKQLLKKLKDSGREFGPPDEDED
ncbi:MAG: hypothetical protein N2167_04770 [Flavobacteriales bacterium]|nr:hypothetical protein [Flavobacteriales bacterium]